MFGAPFLFAVTCPSEIDPPRMSVQGTLTSGTGGLRVDPAKRLKELEKGERPPRGLPRRLRMGGPSALDAAYGSLSGPNPSQLRFPTGGSSTGCLFSGHSGPSNILFAAIGLVVWNPLEKTTDRNLFYEVN